MSRLIVKNLPKKITEDKLRQVFGENGTITDIQLKYTKEGTFRRFCFIGFQTEDESERAIQSLHNTFINTSKITVEKCAFLGDVSKPKAWSKYASDSSAFKNNAIEETASNIDREKTIKKTNKIEEIDILEKYKDDPMFEEFLQAHGDSDKIEKLKKNVANLEDNNSVSNSDEEKIQTENYSDEGDDVPQQKLSEKPITDLEYMQRLIEGSQDIEKNIERKPRQKMEKKIKEKIELFTIKIKDLPYSTKKKDIRAFFRPNVPFSIRIPRQIHGIAFVGYKAEKAFKKALLKDKSFIKGKQISVTKYEVRNEEKNSEKDDSKTSKWKSQEEALKNEEDIGESGRIFFRNLSYTTTEADIEALFSKYGLITEISLPIDNTTRKIKGFGVVTFMMPEHAVKAYSELDGSILHGRMLHLLPGKAKDNIEENLDESTDFKKKKAAKQKSEAGSGHNWNSLFLGPNAVAEVIADSYGTSKENVIGPDGQGSAAVRLALGETQIIAETRKYLEERGVILDVFSSAPKTRSKTIILVKHLPSRTEDREIREVFEKYGELGRVILPPSGITALVEFIEPSEAKKAFAKLAYSRFKHVPLFLEWAPENTLSENKQKKQDMGEHESTKQVDSIQGSGDKNNVKEVEEQKESEDEAEPEPDTTLFIKNLNFQTTDEGLKQHFEPCGKLKYATVATKKDTKHPGLKLSMGYGFVQFFHKKSADKALRTLQQSVLDGKSLELKRSERTSINDVKSAKKSTKITKQTGSKILVRNIPFQAKKKDISELFSTFGEIKALRLPKKMNSEAESHRGFAFIDYVTESEAKAAFEALSQSTHLFGRRLVLEWATTEEGIEDIRKRTADHFGTKEVVKSKKSVFQIE